MSADRVLPHSLDAERAVLGASMVNPDACLAALEAVKPEHFFRHAHKVVFEAIGELASHGQAVDTLTVKNQLLTDGTLEDAGGPAYLAGLVDGVPRSTNVGDYARIVIEKARLRATIFAANKILTDAYDAAGSADQVLARAEATLSEASTHRTGGFKKLSDMIPGLLDQIESWCASKTGVTGLRTGLRELDEQTRGLQAGNILIVAARPSMGKTSLAENIGRNVAKSGRTVGMVSLEMSETEVAIRSVSADSGIDSHRLQRGRLYDKDWTKLTHSMGELEKLPFYVMDTPAVTPMEIRARAKRLQQEHGLALLIVDYVQLMDAGIGKKSDNRNMELSLISRTLKQIARELSIPVIVLSQLSRDLERRQDKRPQLSDLRDTGALEQDADLVLFLYRPVKYEPHRPNRDEFAHLDQAGYERYAELILAKQRNGPTGTIEVQWIGERTQFVDRDADIAVSAGGSLSNSARIAEKVC